MKTDLISRSKLIDGYDVRKVTEYDETGYGIDYKAVPVEVIVNAPAVDAIEVVRCKDCVNWMPRHIKLNDGTTRFYLPGEKDVSISVGINVGSQCLVDCNSGYAEDKAVFRSANEFCSRGIRREGSEGSE